MAYTKPKAKMYQVPFPPVFAVAAFARELAKEGLKDPDIRKEMAQTTRRMTGPRPFERILRQTEAAGAEAAKKRKKRKVKRGAPKPRGQDRPEALAYQRTK